MNGQLKITIQEVVDLRVALNNAERRIKELMSLKHEDWHKLYHLDIDSIEKGKQALKTIIQRD
jgi:hypothetical protein